MRFFLLQYSGSKNCSGADKRSTERLVVWPGEGEADRMRKKSHISLGNYLLSAMKLREMEQHRKAFLIGCILPDCKPSFVTKRHEFGETYGEVKEKICCLTRDWQFMFESPKAFWIQTGEVLHYVADYFTYPHNEGYEGSLRDHCSYEKLLKYYLRFYIFSGRAWRNQEELRRFGDEKELFRYIEETHKEYMEEKHSVEGDARYITCVCLQVIAGMYQLVNDRIRQAGRAAALAA